MKKFIARIAKASAVTFAATFTLFAPLTTPARDFVAESQLMPLEEDKARTSTILF